MAYYVSVIRAAGEGKKCPISLDELRGGPFVNSYAYELEERNGFYAFCFYFLNKEDCFLYWKDGDVWTTNPDEEWFEFLMGLASSLGAVLQGDEGEIYLPDGTILPGEGSPKPKTFLSVFSSRGAKFIYKYIATVVLLCLISRLIRDFFL